MLKCAISTVVVMAMFGSQIALAPRGRGVGGLRLWHQFGASAEGVTTARNLPPRVLRGLGDQAEPEMLVLDTVVPRRGLKHRGERCDVVDTLLQENCFVSENMGLPPCALNERGVPCSKHKWRFRVLYAYGVRLLYLPQGELARLLSFLIAVTSRPVISHRWQRECSSRQRCNNQVDTTKRATTVSISCCTIKRINYSRFGANLQIAPPPRSVCILNEETGQDRAWSKC